MLGADNDHPPPSTDMDTPAIPLSAALPRPPVDNAASPPIGAATTYVRFASPPQAAAENAVRGGPAVPPVQRALAFGTPFSHATQATDDDDDAPQPARTMADAVASGAVPHALGATSSVRTQLQPPLQRREEVAAAIPTDSRRWSGGNGAPLWPMPATGGCRPERGEPPPRGRDSAAGAGAAAAPPGGDAASLPPPRSSAPFSAALSQRGGQPFTSPVQRGLPARDPEGMPFASTLRTGPRIGVQGAGAVRTTPGRPRPMPSSTGSRAVGRLFGAAEAGGSSAGRRGPPPHLSQSQTGAQPPQGGAGGKGQPQGGASGKAWKVVAESGAL